jgi:hypothetical protein
MSAVYLFESLRAGADKGSNEVQTFLRTDCHAYLFESLWAGADEGSDEVLAKELALVRFRLALVHVCSK